MGPSWAILGPNFAQPGPIWTAVWVDSAHSLEIERARYTKVKLADAESVCRIMLGSEDDKHVIL